MVPQTHYRVKGSEAGNRDAIGMVIRVARSMSAGVASSVGAG
ncbi:MAG: hypothetical protein AB1847_13565 [bacterium]